MVLFPALDRRWSLKIQLFEFVFLNLQKKIVSELPFALFQKHHFQQLFEEVFRMI